MKNKMRAQSRNLGSNAIGRDRFFNVGVKLAPTGEVFTLRNIHNDMKISELMSYAEFETGIPKHMQRIRYLDECDLLDTTTVRQNDIVGGAQITMTVWSIWTSLIQAVAANDIEQVFKLGVTQDSDYTTPNLEYMMPSKRKAHLADRAFVALFIAANRGHIKLVEKLISEGADVNGQTQLGRTALHVASSMGHGNILDLLLEYGADIDAEDKFNDNALTIAGKFGHKGCERHLFLFRWQQRAKQVRSQVYVPMFAHQYHDSANPVWLKGTYQQIYFTHILPPGEFEGSHLSAPKRPGFQGYGKDNLQRLADSNAKAQDSSDEESSEDDSSTQDGKTRLPKIREERGLGSATSSSILSSATHTTKPRKKKKDKRTAFDIWLEKKQQEDAVRLALAREEKRKKKEAEEQKQLAKQTEEWKKAEELKAKQAEKSYDKWLAEQEQAAKPKAGGATGGKPAAALKSTHDIIRSLIARKQVEGGYHGLPYEIWTAEREPKMYNQIKVHGNLLLEHYTQDG